ncbi:hypothetical protein LAZ40_09210 [Cereibacter sphaeroides]|uniref:hypothetical protein n=1 Tax=Cereibacter sphaeroides TaxID=1063 RepID=UPI001F1A0DFC|nr:hypothetical protein [Cereibacter sphaeroides]MCE6959229.1 hypothetical protein [Cereibacter sphaeroides]MCE6972032.1 hypothetical protein [Cereibacter sphaeroides]
MDGLEGARQAPETTMPRIEGRHDILPAGAGAIDMTDAEAVGADEVLDVVAPGRCLLETPDGSRWIVTLEAGRIFGPVRAMALPEEVEPDLPEGIEGADGLAEEADVLVAGLAQRACDFPDDDLAGLDRLESLVSRMEIDMPPAAAAVLPSTDPVKTATPPDIDGMVAVATRATEPLPAEGEAPDAALPVTNVDPVPAEAPVGLPEPVPDPAPRTEEGRPDIPDDPLPASDGVTAMGEVEVADAGDRVLVAPAGTAEPPLRRINMTYLVNAVLALGLAAECAWLARGASGSFGNGLELPALLAGATVVVTLFSLWLLLEALNRRNRLA